MSDVSPKVIHMSSVVLSEACGHVATLIGRQPPGFKLKQAWPRVARLIGTTERRIRAIWHQEARAIRADELDALRAAVAAKHLKSQGLTDDRAALAAQFERTAERLAQTDAAFFGADVERLRGQALQLRGMVDGGLT